ncbi:MAG: hypothetical protein IPK52_18345 [Chloroflexi bacterium]|nr:hypothetical protein [Chloroflexota bacterium]
MLPRLDAAGHLVILPQRPTIYKLYEENIGPLTGLIGDELTTLKRRTTRRLGA